MTAWNRNLLWTDCTAGAVVGVVVLALSGWLSDLHDLPRSVLVFTGVMNLAYASYSFSLARRQMRPRVLVQILAIANMAWAPVCIILSVMHWESASVFGHLHLLGEAAFVGGLGAYEWTQQDRLLTAS